jgi:hypothetical protein
MGLLALATLPLYGSMFEAMTWVMKGLARSETGYVLYHLSSHAIALAIMFPATFCAKRTVAPSGVNCPGTCRFAFEESAFSSPEPSTGFTVSRLPALDFSIGFDDFVLMPIVPAELYARMRQVDWRTATFGNDDLLKIDDLVIYDRVLTAAEVSAVMTGTLQRGISREDAVSMIVNGFCKQVFKELPMEFAVEAQKLLAISLEGSVG